MVMAFLQQMNFFFKDPKETERMSQKVYEQIRDNEETSGNMYVLVRISNAIRRWSKHIVIIMMLAFITFA